MPYLIPNEQATVFNTVVHHFSNRTNGPRLVESPSSRMVVVAAPWAEVQGVLLNLGCMKAAAYLLAGANWPAGNFARCYVGETTDLMSRLKKHANDPTKGFVSEVFVIGTRDQRFDKFDVQFFQFRLNARIEKIDSAHIVRGLKPFLPSGDQFRIKQSEKDFADVRRLMPSLGCNLLEAGTNSFTREDDAQNGLPADWRDEPVAETPRGVDADVNVRSHGMANSHAPIVNRTGQPVTHGNSHPSFFVLNHASLTAYGYQHGAEFVVLPGSEMRREPMKSFKYDLINKQRRTDIIDAQVAADMKGYQDRWRLTRERRFPSRAIAAKVLMGVNLPSDAWVAVTPDPRPG